MLLKLCEFVDKRVNDLLALSFRLGKDPGWLPDRDQLTVQDVDQPTLLLPGTILFSER